MNQKQLEKFFSPQSIAVIGASNHVGKVGNDVMVNLKNNFNGKLYPVNPHDSKVLGFKAFASIADLPETPELAVIIIKAELVIDAVEQLVDKGCKNFVIISAGFKEIGGKGIELENKLQELKNKFKLKILGPNCLGYISTKNNVNASFARSFPLIGNIGFFSQSGALGTAVLDLAQAQQVGFSYFISLGNKLDINESDLLDYFLVDKQTSVILAYLESITDGQNFIQQAKKVTTKKPVIVLKAGKTKEGSQAVSSHTGSMAGVAEVYSSAFKQSGIIEAFDLEDFFALAKGFSCSKLPRGKRVAIITNAGGPGILITDLLMGNGLELAKLSNKTKNILKEKLPEAAATHNPIDILGDAKSDRYQLALEIVATDSQVDSIIVVLTPQKMSEIQQTIQVVGKLNKQIKQTLICCFLGEAEINKYYPDFSHYGLAQFNYPAQAVKVLKEITKYATTKPINYSIKDYHLPVIKSVNQKINLIELNENDSRQILSKYQFPLHRAQMAVNHKEALMIAKKIGYPVAVKVVSSEIIHKSDVGGVKIGINNNQQLIQAISEIESNIKKKQSQAKIDGYLIGEMVDGLQIILGMKRDPQFGPLIMVGLGGIYTEIFKDIAFRIAPFNRQEAQKILEELKIYPLLKGVRGKQPFDKESLVNLIVKLAKFSLIYPQITEIDFNPVMVLEQGRGVKIVDVRMLK